MFRRLKERRAAAGRSALTALPVLVAALSLIALVSPLRDAEEPLVRVGAILFLVGGLEILHALRRADTIGLRRGITSGAVTLVMAFVVLSVPYLAGAALVAFLAVTFGIEGVGYARAAVRGDAGSSRTFNALAAAGDLAAAIVLVIARGFSITWLVAIAAAARMLGVAWTMAVTPVHTLEDASQTVIDDLELRDRPEIDALQHEVANEEALRKPGDRRLIIAFVVILFSIHVARMQVDGSLLGYLAPGIALAGDMLLAVLLTLMLVIPFIVSLRGSTRWLERRVWHRYLSGGGDTWRRRAATGWLKYRLRVGMRLREARYSLPAALQRGLVTGLPVAAIVAATVPVWGMSWFFDTENWASGIWNSWAESRTDEWRAAMIPAVAGPSGVTATTFAVTPPGVDGDFSFIVIGDTGEGDASQQVLRDQILSVAGRDEVRFVVISSDVIYPNGAMIDYENKFWLQFKGVTKPVYAIPGNHDWYDALEAFLATFLTPDAARAAMEARADADLRLTSSTHARIESLIDRAAQLRSDYGVPTGFQRGPFFEIQTPGFALVAIDTGIVKRIDALQWRWLEAALDRARGKTTMAILGHPFYAGGHEQTADNPEFTKIKRLLLERGVHIMMAGDTHDLEYYAETPVGGNPVHYFVNGGGGAYLSFGTALQWPTPPPTQAWAYYPSRNDVVRKIEARTPKWKRPAWWWTRQFNAWPFSAEWLSGVFDYNVAPFFQSFFEVRVEPSAHRIRLVPYGVHGPLRWRDLDRSGLGTGEDDNSLVEWTVPMN
ncbi:MAG TPA: metallophosphoesterase [Vicinamibacterales bacterium]|nr:metallophosphoesterase [Vicinamibacterales bacterium]